MYSTFPQKQRLGRHCCTQCTKPQKVFVYPLAGILFGEILAARARHQQVANWDLALALVPLAEA
eukprot:12909735-Prorocentrum_lima.AAC.1